MPPRKSSRKCKPTQKQQSTKTPNVKDEISPDQANKTEDNATSTIVTSATVPSVQKKYHLRPRKEKEVEYKASVSENAEKRPASKKRKIDTNDDGPSSSAKSTKVVGVQSFFKGQVEVDKIFIQCDPQSVYVYFDESGVYDCLLNQTSFVNNHNKFYKMQVLRDDDFVDRYFVLLRWGRVGLTGKFAISAYNTAEEAISVFKDKFNEKTNNDWINRYNFVKCDGKYDYIPVQYAEKAPTIPTKVESKLHESLQNLMNNITDTKAMEKSVVDYDASKAPLGALSKEQIKAGYIALKHVEKLIKEKKFGKALSNAVEVYYTKIPHTFGMKTPPLITTEEQLSAEVDLMSALEHITFTVARLNNLKKAKKEVCLIDKAYEAMNCKITPLSEKDEAFELISDYLKLNHGPSHIYRTTIENVFSIEKIGEAERFRSDLGNRMLLWHGSRMSNYYGILSNGLRIAPLEAPPTGSMFGRGIYFADVSSKAANYCHTGSGKHGLLLLAEVALGKIRELRHCNYNANLLDDGMDSSKGVGHLIPSPDGHKSLIFKAFVISGEKFRLGEALVPCGKMVHNVNGNGILIYNEYVVYNVNQVCLRYLVEVKFV